MKTKLLIILSLLFIIGTASAEPMRQFKEIKLRSGHGRPHKPRSHITPPVQAFIDKDNLTLEFTQPTPSASIQIIHIETGNVVYMDDATNPEIVTIDLTHANEGGYELEISIGKGYYTGEFEIHQ